MMSSQRAQCLLKLCTRWSRPARVNICKVSRSNYLCRRLVLSQQRRALSSEPERGGAIDLDDDQEHVDLANVFKKIQQETGIQSLDAQSQTLTDTEQTFLQTELKLLATEWRELGHVVEGEDMSGSALVMFVEENITSAPYGVLCKLVRSFSKVFDKESKQFQMVLDEGIQRMSNETLIQMLFFVNTLNQLPADKIQSKYFELSLEKIKAKMGSEISPVELLFALSVLRKNQMPEIQDRLENVAIQQLVDMDVNKVIDLFQIRALDRNRSPNLIRGIVGKLNASDFDRLSISDMSKLLYSCATLNVFNRQLLEKISMRTAEILKNKEHSADYRHIRPSLHSITYSCKSLHWKNDAILKELSLNLRRNISNTNKKEVVEDVMSLCYLGYKVPDIVRNYGHTVKDLKKIKPVNWLKYIHATASVRLAKLEDIKQALDQEFYLPILAEAKGYQAEAVKRMLLNLQGCLEVDFGVKDQPLAEADGWINNMEVHRGKNSLSYTIELALKQIAFDLIPGRLDNYGHRIDFEFSMRPSPNSDKSVKAAVRVLEFNEMVQGSRDISPTGPTSMAIRHLAAQKTPVLCYPYYEWKRYQMNIENSARLEAMIKEMVDPKNEEASPSQPSQQASSQ